MDTDKIAIRIARFVEQMGLNAIIENSMISESKYIVIESDYKIRVSNHELPFSYAINSDSPDLFVGGSTGCTWQQAIEKVAEHFNKQLPGTYVAYRKRMQTIKEKNETASNIAQANQISKLIDQLKNSVDTDWKVESTKRSKWFYFNDIQVCGMKSWTWEDARDSKIKELQGV